ncbi:pilin [Patescibacteria group bacterium]|nr:pilin [Patescibacteria group bacterium]
MRFKFLENKYRTNMILLAVCAAAFFASIPHLAHAAFLPLPSTEELDVPTPTGETAAERFESILGPLARSIRIVVGAIAGLLIVVSGITMVLGGESEETVTNQKKSIMYGVIGLIMISVAGPIAEVFDFRAGNIVADDKLMLERAALFNSATRLIITFLKYMLGSLAALMFIRAGATMVMSGQSEEDITREKKNLIYSGGGLMMVIFSDLVVRKVLFATSYNEDTQQTVAAVNQNEFVTQLVAITNIVVSFVGPVMMLGLVIGAVMFVTAHGNEEQTEKAKKIIINSVIGIVIIYGAFALVSTVINGVF